MKRFTVALSVGMIAACASPHKSSEPRALGSASEVFVLGSIHGNMLDQPMNSLKDFVEALELFRPNLILSEVRSGSEGPVPGILEGAIEQSLVYAFAKQKSIPVLGIDSVDDTYNLESTLEDERMNLPLKKEIEPLFAQFREIVQKGSFVQSQSMTTEQLIRKRYDLMAQHGFSLLRNRDRKICENIKSHSQRFRGQRVLVVFGIAHKHNLEDCFRGLGSKPLSLENWYPSLRNQKSFVSNEMKLDAIQSVKTAQSLLRLKSKKLTKNPDVEALKERIQDLDQWISEIQKL